MWSSPARLYLNPDGSVSETPEPGAVLFVCKGGLVTNEQADAFGLRERYAPVAEPEEASESKAVAEPPEDKAVRQRSVKGRR